MIEGLNIRCNVGGFEVLRTPHLKLSYRRRAVLTRGEIDLPDTDRSLQAALAKGQPVKFRFGYRGSGLWHEWQGTIDGFEMAGPDTLRVLAGGRELALQKTTITESYHGEPAATVAKRLLQATGLPLGEISIPDEILPHIVFSSVTVARAIRQLAQSLERSFGHDLSRHAVWLGQNGLNWSDADEPGPGYTLATCENLIDHRPSEEPGGLHVIDSVLLAGLTDGQKVRLVDSRRGIDAKVKALEVEHLMETGSNNTRILYGAEHGWC